MSGCPRGLLGTSSHPPEPDDLELSLPAVVGAASYLLNQRRETLGVEESGRFRKPSVARMQTGTRVPDAQPDEEIS